jgi:hypothetical protein
VLARLKGERRQALQGNIPFVILTDLNLVATINNSEQQIIMKICPGFVVSTLHVERTIVRRTSRKESPQSVGQRTEPVNYSYLAACLYTT